ncbi:MAG: iron uptake porin [Cyanobacteria bacterium]|nr:iron uptake porin [Cyanobacteriota bacterium]MDW8201457.1 iron uptake porin [Cyanobacteriota bacterium SKYGB_h_bin112]
MFKISTLWNICLALPVTVLACLVAGNVARAGSSLEDSSRSIGSTSSAIQATVPASTLAMTPTESSRSTVASQPLTTSATDPGRVTNAIDSYYYMAPVDTDPAMLQVTSVTQLSDVMPTDWAYQSLQSLVERYGCIVGYPDGTFRGNRPLSRYEFAAGLNACMDKISELIAQGTADLVSKSDLEAIRKLQEEFAAELATLKGRVDALEARTATLEAQQFSTTTKLSGLAFFNVTGVSGGTNVRSEQLVSGAPAIFTATENPNVTFSNLAWLTLLTSFSGKDQLITQLAVGNGFSPANLLISGGNFFNTWGVPFTDQTAGVDPGLFILRELSYAFPVGDSLRVVVGPRVNIYRYFDDNRYTFILNGVGSFNGSGSTLFNGVDRGAGAVAILKLGDAVEVKAGYFGQSTEFLPAFLNSAADPAKGVFGGLNTAIAELDFYPSKDLSLRFTYARTNQTVSGLYPTATEPVTGIFNFAGRPGTSTNVSSDTLLANFDWKLFSGLGLFGRYGIAFSNLNTTAGNVGQITTQSIQFGVAFPDLFKKGALGTISFLIPYDVTSGRNLLAAGAASTPGLSYSTQYELEANYHFPVTDNISLTPNLIVVFNPNNISGNPTVFVYNLRTQFRF